jgi:nitronate monooxygenase
MESHAKMILPYPIQNKISKQMRDRAKALENPEFMSLWAGQSVANVKYQSVEALFAELVEGL